MNNIIPSRNEMLNRLRQNNHVPVLIVGGGINGMGSFRDLSLQGINCLLVERGDFCSGASRAPSRMIHGGLKYLETGEFRLVRESAEERNRLLLNAAHYVHPLEMIIPIYSWLGGTWSAIRKFLRRPAQMTQRGALIVRAGLTLYDIYGALNRVMPRHRMIRRSDVLREIPDLDPKIKVAASFYDAWITSPERLVVELAIDAMKANPGSMALNHLRFDGIEDGHARLVDQQTGEVFQITCDLMVNAGGAWIDQVNGAAGTPKRMIGGTKGSHLLLDLPVFAETLHGRMVYFEAEGGRLCLISNFMGHVLLGTTDIPIEDPDLAICSDEEVEYLLSAFHQVFPDVAATRDHIYFSYAGVRPLPASDADSPGAISRDHSLPELPPNDDRSFPILSLVGGKWTTFRAFSAQLTDEVLSRLNATRRTGTETIPIGGGANLTQQAMTDEDLLTRITNDYGLTRRRARKLLTRYGSRATTIAAELAGGEDMLTSLPDMSRQEISYVARTEMVLHATDFLFGRSTLFLELPLGLDALREITAVLGASLNWDAAREESEMEAIISRYRDLHRIQVGPETGRAGQFI